MLYKTITLNFFFVKKTIKYPCINRKSEKRNISLKNNIKVICLSLSPFLEIYYDYVCNKIETQSEMDPTLNTFLKTFTFAIRCVSIMSV